MAQTIESVRKRKIQLKKIIVSLASKALATRDADAIADAVVAIENAERELRDSMDKLRDDEPDEDFFELNDELNFSFFPRVELLLARVEDI